MIKNVLTGIGGIEVFGVISIGLFFLVFGGTVLWACLLKKNFLNSMSVLPLAEEPGEHGREGMDHE